MKTLKQVHYSAVIALCALFTIFLLASKTQSKSEQKSNQIKFENCIGDVPTDTVCDSCYTLVMTKKHWINAGLYNNYR